MWHSHLNDMEMSETKGFIPRGIRSMTTARATKTSLENKHLGNGDYFAIIASSWHPLLLSQDAVNGW